MKHYYLDHTGGIFGSDSFLTGRQLYCGDCDDYDVYLGRFKSSAEAYYAYRDFRGFKLVGNGHDLNEMEVLGEKIITLKKENDELKQIIHHLRSQLAERDELMED